MRAFKDRGPAYSGCEQRIANEDERSLYKSPRNKNAANSQTKQRDLFQTT